jgi:hypothetical protein
MKEACREKEDGAVETGSDVKLHAGEHYAQEIQKSNSFHLND